jgi:hypothetical protein
MDPGTGLPRAAGARAQYPARAPFYVPCSYDGVVTCRWPAPVGAGRWEKVNPPTWVVCVMFRGGAVHMILRLHAPSPAQSDVFGRVGRIVL